MQTVHAQAMYYLHRYLSAYSPNNLLDDPVTFGILQASILGLSLKVVVQEYILEILSIRDQLLMFGVQLPPISSERGHHPSCSLVIQESASTDDPLSAIVN